MSARPLPGEGALGRAVEGRLHCLAAGFGPELRAAFTPLAAAVDPGRPAAPRWARYFLAPSAHPVLQLPLWVAEAAQQAGQKPTPAAVEELAEAGATGYLAVHLQDDLLDEERGEPGQTMLLALALHTRHLALLGRVLPAGSPLSQRIQRRWQAYAEAMLLERRLLRGPGVRDEAEFDAELGRSLPLELPPAAGLVAWGLAERLPRLAALVKALIQAHQRFHELVHAEQGRAAGRRTQVVTRHAAHGKAGLRRALLLDGGFDAEVAAVQRHLRRAAEAAEALGSAGAQAHVARQVRWVGELQRALFARLFGEVLAKDAPDRYQWRRRAAPAVAVPQPTSSQERA